MLPPGRPMAVCPILSLLQKVRSCTFCTKLRCSVRYFCIKGKRKISLFIVYSKVSAAAGISIFMQKHDLTAKHPNELSQRGAGRFSPLDISPHDISPCDVSPQKTFLPTFFVKKHR